MSSNTKMLIDATHPEETRVVVQRNGRVEEFDFESAARKLLRGNIYLAKVTRVEPSLQAAFVDYGGNRHGFLAFNEIHPDYYQIPVADRQALIDEEAAAEAELEAAADRRAEALARRAQNRRPEQPSAFTGSTSRDLGDDASDDGDAGSDASHIIDVEEDEHIEEVGGDAEDNDAPPAFEPPAFEPQTFAAAVERSAEIISEDYAPRAAEQRELPERVVPAGDETEPPHMHHEAEDDEDAEEAEQTGEDTGDDNGETHAGDGRAQIHDDRDADAGERSSGRSLGDGAAADFHEEAPVRQRRRPRSYKIQEVIKRRQVILVQVVKEERGNKGAALTTYLSLAGRYTVLMPNTARGGGISRKITNPQDRKRLKAIANELEVPEGMGLIIRTAGAARTKQEIKRDFEY
ncbi:MAG: ribonuclease E/G, partial [Hyphomicrobium sp.]